MIYPSIQSVIRASKQRRCPDYFFHHMPWGTRYAYICEWHALLCGTTKRYEWMAARGRVGAEAWAHLA